MLREFAKIDKEVIFAGLLTRIELWSKERYEEINNYDNMDEIAEQLGINLNFSI
jgi:MraZ protein